MCESVLYQCKKIKIGSAIEFNEDQLEQIVNQKEYNSEFNENQTNMDQDEAVEDYYNFRQTYLKALMNSVLNNTIKELMIKNPSALFHVMLMPTRWFQNDLWEHLDLISKEPFIGLLSPKSQDKNIQQIVLKHFNNIQETMIQHHVQKKVEYGRLMGNFKKALNYSMEDNDQKNLNELILSYIARKEKKLVDSCIYDADNIQDPIAHQGKGRPATKCLKAFTEENSKASTSNTKHANSSNREKGIEVSS
ncbi:4670_t:CDS:2, partial [Dentiscutata erythropus]